ncbi:hypothetical protein FIBSPDRAFT_909472 [Athelia psychrophila]|uniref:Uncharacterized protein n=1 Tax=Athelia psychrophila TaxID=1759441 RepID=A0A166NZC0_9AGAM|nr:hypothetical protein FIBSPDRAFT_909472 [Fibularhizoctonia sp. CBS 109695]
MALKEAPEEEEGDEEEREREGEEPGASPVVSAHVEPEVPDPFLMDSEDDDSEDDSSDEDLGASHSTAPADEISLVRSPQPGSPRSPVTPLAPDVHKDVPPPPPAPESEEDDDDAPDLYLPGLVIPSMFLPIPNTDPLTTLLSKYITQPEKRPVRDLSGEWKRTDFHTLVMSNSWRALARMARDRIVVSNPEELAPILSLWYLRLSSLARLRLYNQTSAEITNLFTVLNGVAPPAARQWLFDRILPFELEVMQARVKYWAGDHMGYLDGLHGLLRKCRSKARKARKDEITRAMWQERGARVCLIIASQLVEMKDYSAAVRLLEPLLDQGPNISTAALRSSIARIYLQSGYMEKALKHFAVVAADSEVTQAVKDMNAAILACAQGEWDCASELSRKLLDADPEDFAALNNLSVSLLGQGKLKEGITILESALKTSPATVVVAEAYLFNLSTLYELRSAMAVEKKKDLLIEVAKWSGDGLKTTCLKMPTN